MAVFISSTNGVRMVAEPNPVSVAIMAATKAIISTKPISIIFLLSNILAVRTVEQLSK